MMRQVAISGVTGFVGRGLPDMLRGRGYEVTGISRAGRGEVSGVTRWQSPETLDVSRHSAVIHLSGEPVDQRWTERARKKFHESRIGTTRKIVEAIGKCPQEERPGVLINASAVGFYGNRGDESLTETSEKGEGYLANLCAEWEAAAMEAERFGVRVVVVRIGIVLGRGSRAFGKLERVFKVGLGGRLGSGKQWMPWIHLDDMRAVILHALESETLHGPVNGTAPTPERNVDFTWKLAKSLRRPTIFPVPGFTLRLVLGEFAEALLGGQRASPEALEKDGFVFRYPTLESALSDLVG